jgi:hypothetical protein
MVMNQLEFNLEAITNTLAHLEKEGCEDQELLSTLRYERDKLLKDLHVKF